MSDAYVVTEQPLTATIAATTESTSIGVSNSGIDLLNNYETLIVKQERDVIPTFWEKIFCFDRLNKYKIKDINGKTVMNAVEEEEGCCAANCCRRGGKFEMKIKDSGGHEVVHLKMKNQCCNRWCCFCCCTYEKLNVYTASDGKIGSIEESYDCCHKQLNIYSVSKSDPIYTVNGPNCECFRCCCVKTTFSIENESGEECGSIVKNWSGLAKEAINYVDNFCINFPLNIDLKEKAILLGTCIMIDFMYYEESPKKAKHDEE